MNLTKTDIRKAVGRGAFTAPELAEALEVTGVTARKHLSRLVEDEKVAVEGKRETGKRGRPATEYRVVKGR